MKRIIKLIIALAAGVLSAANLKAQSLDPFSQYGYFTPGVEAFAMTKYGGLTPSLYTGAMSLSIPLYTYEDPDFTIPISLEYNFDGYRPAQASGTVGYGWHLNCGGVITREVCGIPDEGDINVSGPTRKGWREGRSYFNSAYPAGITAYDQIHSSCSLGESHITPETCVGKLSSYDIFGDTPLFVRYADSESHTVMYDLAPDIYHYAFCGHSGYFMMARNGNVLVYNSDTAPGEVSVQFEDTSFPSMISEIKITMGDGTEYRFTEGDISSTPNLDDDILRPRRAITSWVLKSITAPNGRMAEFTYSFSTDISVGSLYLPIKDGSYITESSWQVYCDQGFISQSDPVKWVVTNTSTSIPSALRIKDPSIGAVSASVEFSYEAALQDEFNYTCYDDNSVFRTYIGGQSKRLSRIAVRNADASLADEYTLSHSYATSGTPKLFLSSVSGMKSGRYEFSYNTQGITFPKNNTRACDHWGFWNGKPISDLRDHLKNTAWLFHQPAMISPLADTLLTPGEVQPPSEERPVSAHLYDQMLDGDNCKDPVFEKAKAGALTSVVYPTGGRSDIEYEANTVTRRINVYNGGTSPSPVLENCATANEVGGVRVARITNSSSDGSISDTTSYSYSGGILQQMPKYSEKVSYTHLCYSSHEARGIGCVMTVNAMGFNNCCGFLLCRDFHVGYPEVTITHQDQSRTVHRFLSAADYLDIHSSGTSWMKRVYCNDDYIEADYTTPLPVCMVHPSTDYAPMRGREASVTVYDAQGNVVSCQENSYTTYSRTIPELFYNDLLTYNRSSYAVVSPQLTRTVRTENGVTVTTDTEYNSLGQVQMQTVSSQVNSPEEGVSSGELTQTTRVRTRYLHESTSPTPLTGAADAIVITDVDTASGREKIISAQSCTYGTGGNPFPLSVTAYESWGETLPAVEGRAGIFSRALGGSGRTISYGYDNLFRPVTVTLPGSETFTYSWQNGVRVTQKTQGTAANRTLFQWKDLVGLSSLGTPDGQRQSYVYDDRNRLKRISDRNGKPVTRYNYKMKNESTINNQ